MGYFIGNTGKGHGQAVQKENSQWQMRGHMTRSVHSPSPQCQREPLFWALCSFPEADKTQVGESVGRQVLEFGFCHRQWCRARGGWPFDLATQCCHLWSSCLWPVQSSSLKKKKKLQETKQNSWRLKKVYNFCLGLIRSSPGLYVATDYGLDMRDRLCKGQRGKIRTAGSFIAAVLLVSV